MMHRSEREAVRAVLDELGATDRISDVMRFLRREGRPLSVAVRRGPDEPWLYVVQSGGKDRVNAILDRIASGA